MKKKNFFEKINEYFEYEKKFLFRENKQIF